MSSFTGAAYLAMMSSNWLNPSNYPARRVEMKSTMMALAGAVHDVLLFEGLNISDRGPVKGWGHTAGKPLRWLTTPVCKIDF